MSNTELLERLRKEAKGFGAAFNVHPTKSERQLVADLTEAASEIERLQSELQRLTTRPEDGEQARRTRQAPVVPKHWNGVGKYTISLGFEPGFLNIDVAGHGSGDGHGVVGFKDEDLEFEQEDGPLYRWIAVPNSELLYLRDKLNEIFPPDSSTERAAIVAWLREEAADEDSPFRFAARRIADQIESGVYLSPIVEGK